MHDESLYAEHALRSGASGYITKHESADNVLLAIRRVLAGEVYLSGTLTSAFLKGLAAGLKPTGGSCFQNQGCLIDFYQGVIADPTNSGVISRHPKRSPVASQQIEQTQAVRRLRRGIALAIEMTG